MRDESFIEKSFLYLLVLSLLLHIAVFVLGDHLLRLQPHLPQEPVFIDMADVPDLMQPPSTTPARRKGEKQVRVKRETAPRGVDSEDRGQRPTPPQQASRPSSGGGSPGRGSLDAVRPGESRYGLLKYRSKTTKSGGGGGAGQPSLSPSASRLAQMENIYRRRYEKEIAEGTTKFLNTDDDRFGSFLNRFRTAIYLYWRYPDEAIRQGMEGTTPVKITFNRRGEIIKIKQLESSGYKVLDDEVIRTLKQLGPMGGFPKGYDKDEFNLIGFFHYGSSRRSLR